MPLMVREALSEKTAMQTEGNHQVSNGWGCQPCIRFRYIGESHALPPFRQERHISTNQTQRTASAAPSSQKHMNVRAYRWSRLGWMYTYRPRVLKVWPQWGVTKPEIVLFVVSFQKISFTEMIHANTSGKQIISAFTFKLSFSIPRRHVRYIQVWAIDSAKK
jgi:hypothetical protein